MRKFGWPDPGSPIVSDEILLGERCNARCLFCCADGMTRRGGWMSFAAIRSRLRRAAARGAWLVTLSGGEATLCPDLERTAREARRLGFKSVQLLTNGFRLTDPAYVRGLGEAGIDEIKISLHGVDAATHDRLMGVKGAFRLAMRAAENIARAGLKASFNFAVTRSNYRQMPLFAKFAGTDLGVTGFCFMFSFYSGAMLKLRDELSVRYSEVLPSLRCAMDYIKAKGITIESKMLNNFPPCVVPEYANLISDWGAASPEAASSVGGHKPASRMPEFYSPRKTRIPACAACAYGDRCYGVDKGYLETFGAGEFRAVKKIRRRFPLKSLYP